MLKKQNLFITIMTTTNSMSPIRSSILDILAAFFMQLSIWKWEIRMIANYGFDWDYKGPWDRF